MNIKIIAQGIISTTAQFVHSHQMRVACEEKFQQIFKADNAVIHHASGKVYTVVNKHCFSVLFEDSCGAIALIDFAQPDGCLKLELMDSWGLISSAACATHHDLAIA